MSWLFFYLLQKLKYKHLQLQTILYCIVPCLYCVKKAGAVNLNPHTRNFWHKQGWFQPVLGLAVPKKPVL